MTRCWWRGPGKRLPLDRARLRHHSTNGLPVSSRATFQSTLPNVFFGGDAALGPKNIITAVAQGHEAAVSIDRFLHGEAVAQRPAPLTPPVVAEDGHPRVELRQRCLQRRRASQRCPGRRPKRRWPASSVEVELGFDAATAFKEASAALNCDVQTVFNRDLCIECDGCVDICPMDCITFTANGDEGRSAYAPEGAARILRRPLYVSPELKTGRDGEGRRRLPALRPVRRTLPRPAPGTCRSSAAQHHARRGRAAATAPKRTEGMA